MSFWNEIYATNPHTHTWHICHKCMSQIHYVIISHMCGCADLWVCGFGCFRFCGCVWTECCDTRCWWKEIRHKTLWLQPTATLYHTLQLTATHCNTLQHSATHCNTLQLTATHCNTLQYTATHCNTLPHTATYCNTRVKRHASSLALYYRVYKETSI